MASGASMDSNASAGGTLPRHFPTSTDRLASVNAVVNDTEALRHEVSVLRRQQSETSRSRDHAMKETDYYRAQHRAVLNQIESATQENNNWRVKYADLLADKQRSERDVQRLQKEVSKLHSEQLIPENGNSDTIVISARKYEALKNEYETLRQRYDDLTDSHNSLISKYELSQEDSGRIKKQCDELIQERNSMTRERNALKQQCTSAIRQWDMALRERNEYRDALSKVTGQHEEAVKEINQAMAIRMKASKDIKRLTEERNAAIEEYSMIMSERTIVHSEIEKLSDDLSESYKKSKTLEAQCEELTREKKTLSYQAETLRREIASALHDRDKALKECNDLREKFGEYTKDESRGDFIKSRLEFNQLMGENTNRKENENSTDKFHMNQREREKVDNLDTANQELDRLRKNVDMLQAELTEATQEAEVSKRRRDWAFSERDKIVLERESIRTLCDRLRKERDRAVSDLAEALRDSDDIKKQRNEALKELKDLKEKMENQLEKEVRIQQFHAIGHNNSQDSAIDADLHEWETEIVDLNLSNSKSDIGIEIVGGRDDQRFPNDSSVYISSIAKGSAAEGKLKVNDCICRVNNIDCSSVSRRTVLEALRTTGPRYKIMLRRRRMHTRCLYTVQLPLISNIEHGLTIENGLYISKITPGSLAAKEGNLAVGDRVLNINNTSMDGVKSAHEAMCILNDLHCDMLTITTLKQVSHPSTSSANTPTHIGQNQSIEKPSNTHKMIQTDDSNKNVIVYQAELVHQDKKHLSVHGDRAVYKISNGKSADSKGNHNTGPWEMIREKFDAVRGRRHSKDRPRNDEKKYLNSSPQALSNNYLQAQDALAELDSVLDSYHRTSSKGDSGPTKQSKRRKDNSQSENMKNGGTWPKARTNVILQQNPTGTIVQSRPKKERPALTLLNTSAKFQHEAVPHCCSNRNSNPIPMNVQTPVNTSLNRHSVYTSIESSVSPGIHFSQSGQLLCDKKSFTPVTFNKSDFDNDNGNRNSVNLTPSENSLDYSKSPSSIDFASLNLKSPASSLDFVLKNQHGKDGTDYFTTSKIKNTKYSIDNESLGPESLSLSLNGAGTLPSHSRIQSQLYSGNRTGQPLFPSLPFGGSTHPHPHPHAARYPSPVTIPPSQSGENIGGYCFEPPYSPSFHSHGASVDLHYNSKSKVPTLFGRDREEHGYTHGYEGGTFPRKKENQRFRIPSNPSVTSKNSAGKVSTGSIEHNSERGSPMPTFHVEVLSPGNNSNKRNSLPDYGWTQKPSPGELRRVHIDKSVEPLGIKIECLASGGVFVSNVTEHSLASQVGLTIGDQLLEVCGINMRSATYNLAANVLRQCGNSITMLVQYSPDKYNDLEESVSSSSDEGSVSRSGSPTPRNSPKPPRAAPVPTQTSSQENARAQGQTLTRSQIAQANTLQRQNASAKKTPDEQMNKTPQNIHDPRFLFIETRKCSNLGISLVGGNAVGIFVHSVQADSLAHSAGLRTGDQILEYNGADLRRATAEQAAYELAKPADKVTVLVHYNLDRYNEIKDKPGDSLYIRAGFDRVGDLGDSLQLRFNKDDVLYVDNTMFNGVPGHWRAWQLDSDGHRRTCGIIPSKYKVEEELLLRRSLGDLENDTRRGATSARRSFFRRKKHQRSSSRDSKELASFSNITLGWYSDSGALNEEGASYQRVERLDYPVYRPVLIIGPLSDCVVDKLVADPGKFKRCLPEIMHTSQAEMEKGIHDNVFVDYRKKGSFFECTTVNAVKDICDKNSHCILDVSVNSVERLHRHQIYPIVLLIRFKHSKQIKEVKDARYPMDKVSAKAAKEMFEHALKLEADYKHVISAVIPAGVNIAHMCTQIKAAVETEQNKTLWVASAGS